MNKDLCWIWQQPDWPNFYWHDDLVMPRVRGVRLKQGILLGKVGAIDDDLSQEAVLDALLQNIITSSAIEGEQLNVKSVRSSLAKRLGLNHLSPYATSNRSEGLAQMMFDAVNNLDNPLSLDRLLQWHKWLFPDVSLSLQHIEVGALRGEEVMQVVSGRIDKPTVHFEAPPRDRLEIELTHFIDWFNQSHDNLTLDPLLRAAICHLWFVTLHPFDDGNGRMTRALTDLALAQTNRHSIRFYAMSVTILAKRNQYYQILEQCQRNTTDITPWIIWFLDTLEETLQTSLKNIESTLKKTRYWQHQDHLGLSAEQIKVLNRLLDGGEKGFEQGINAAKYQAVAKVSKATATRHLSELLARGYLEKLPGGGRNTRYQIRYT